MVSQRSSWGVGIFKKHININQKVYFEPYIDAAIANMFGDIMFNPIFGITVAVGKVLQLIIGNADHDLNACPGEGTDCPRICIEKFDFCDAIVL